MFQTAGGFHLALSVHLKSFLISDYMFHIRVPGLEAP
jgi:hypothetical protein